MVTVGLDLSSVCSGFSVVQDGELVCWGEIKRSKGNKGDYSILLFNEVQKLASTHHPALAIIEDVHAFNARTAKTLARIAGVAELALRLSGVEDIRFVPPKQLRLAVFGQGNITKENACIKLEDKFNRKLATKGFDAADAITCAVFGANCI